MDDQARWRVSPASAAAELSLVGPPNLWRTIWFFPRRTIRQLLSAEPHFNWRPLAALALLASILSVINQWLVTPADSYLDLARQCAVMTVLWIAWFWIGVDLQARYGRLRGGRGVTHQVRVAAAVSNIPLIALSVCWMCVWLSTGGEGVTLLDPAQRFIPNLFGLAAEVGGWWAFVVSIITLAEVHHFSIWKAFENLLVIGFVTGLLYFALQAA